MSDGLDALSNISIVTQYKVVRTYPRDYCAITTEQLEQAFNEDWQFVTVNPVGTKGVLEYVLCKEITKLL